MQHYWLSKPWTARLLRWKNARSTEILRRKVTFPAARPKAVAVKVMDTHESKDRKLLSLRQNAPKNLQQINIHYDYKAYHIQRRFWRDYFHFFSLYSAAFACIFQFYHRLFLKNWQATTILLSEKSDCLYACLHTGFSTVFILMGASASLGNLIQK